MKMNHHVRRDEQRHRHQSISSDSDDQGWSKMEREAGREREIELSLYLAVRSGGWKILEGKYSFFKFGVEEIY